MADFVKGEFTLPEDALLSLFYLVAFLLISMASYKMYTIALLSLSYMSSQPQMGSSEHFRNRCLNFKLNLPNVYVDLVEYLEQGRSASLPYRHITCGGAGYSAAVAQDVCRIALGIRTSEWSHVHFEAWLPQNFNNRFLAAGNGGLNGCIDYASLVYATEHGFAAVAANNGHNGTSGLEFYQNPNVLHDYADRSMHTSVITGKALTKQFYGTEPKKSYYLGCSQGGRQGIANAEKFPDDFDGIIAGAPAVDFNSLIAWRASFFPITGPFSSPDFIQPEIWSELIHKEVLRQCDSIDGVNDGIIEHPDECQFRPEVLACKETETRNCLSASQINQIHKIFSPFTYPDKTLLFPGMQLGSEIRAIDRLLAGVPFSDSQDWFRYVVHSDPTWDPAKFTLDDARVAQRLNPFDIRTFPTSQDLSRFRSKGGKILAYHGMQDQQITGHNTARWYDYLASKTSASGEIDDWLRYFRISGMYHCSGGPGAWMIGQTSGSVSYEPHCNVLAALVKWVEEGEAPEVIEGTKMISDTAPNGGQVRDVKFKRRHCRYPKRNRYRFQLQPSADFQSLTRKLPTSSTADDWICV